MIIDKQPHKHLLKEIAKRYGVKKVIYPKMTLTQQGFNDEDLFEGHEDIGPMEWLSLIRDARLIVTDSFHGFCFSVIWQKDFLLLKRADYAIEETAHFRFDNIIQKF